MRQRDRADFGGREQALLGFRLQERFVGVAEQAAADGVARAVGGVGVADEDHYVERVELFPGDLSERDAVDPIGDDAFRRRVEDAVRHRRGRRCVTD